MNSRSISTNNDIVSIIKSGHASQSSFSEAFISAVKREMNVDIVACYVQTGEYNTFRKGKPTDEFVDEVLVIVYLREASLQAVQAGEKFDEAVEAIFWNTVHSIGLQWSYERTYLPDELAYYGFTKIPYDQWDMDKILKPVLPPRKSFVVKIESFDQLALYHLLSDKVTSVGNCIRQTYGGNARVYVGFINRPPHMATHFIVFNTQKEYEHFLSHVHPTAVLSTIREKLKVYDYWNVLNTCSYDPQYRVWHTLSGEEKMCLLREAHD